MTQGAILLITGCPDELLEVVAREEPNAPGAAMAAARINNEQKRRRKCNDVKALFDVIELFLF